MNYSVKVINIKTKESTTYSYNCMDEIHQLLNCIELFNVPCDIIINVIIT